MNVYIKNTRISALKRIINCSLCLHTAFLKVNNVHSLRGISGDAFG